MEVDKDLARAPEGLPVPTEHSRRAHSDKDRFAFRSSLRESLKGEGSIAPLSPSLRNALIFGKRYYRSKEKGSEYIKL